MSPGSILRQRSHGPRQQILRLAVRGDPIPCSAPGSARRDELGVNDLLGRPEMYMNGEGYVFQQGAAVYRSTSVLLLPEWLRYSLRGPSLPPLCVIIPRRKGMCTKPSHHCPNITRVVYRTPFGIKSVVQPNAVLRSCQARHDAQTKPGAYSHDKGLCPDTGR